MVAHVKDLVEEFSNEVTKQTSINIVSKDAQIAVVTKLIFCQSLPSDAGNPST